MTRRLLTALAVALLAVPAALAATPRPTLTLTPVSVMRGHVVRLQGTAGDCSTRDAVTLLSKAFVHTHDFAGLPAIYAQVKAGHTFSVETKIPATKATGRYTVTARCGGGNLGFAKTLTVLG
jgi:hypothetical protein